MFCNLCNKRYHYNIYNVCIFHYQIAAKIGVANDSVKNMIIWGNHSSTQFPDVAHALAEVQGKFIPVVDAVKDDAFLKNEFIKVRLYHLISSLKRLIQTAISGYDC